MEDTAVDQRVYDQAVAWQLATMESDLRTVGSVAERALQQAEQRIGEAQRQTQRYAEQLRLAENRAAQAASGLEKFKQTVAGRMNQEARDRGWCDDFAEIMREVGLGEYVEQEREIRISFETTIRVTGEDDPDEADIEEAATEYLRHSSVSWEYID